ncbi:MULTISPECIES: baseplate J/gp47 family protein [unclassified Bradyrhizobium]|uniref:baseplate J/gp47 family protein n=1 Tax=unclassified Bradyrhizobium TaxID=2631580 RepID=UPI0028E92222|nr:MULTISPECIES: baseplate J/gp47 family protein [unclassified Bradyrhizobium]
MSYYLPTLKDLMQKARISFRANLKGSDASVWPNNVYVSAKVLAGALYELFGFAAYIKKQIFAHQAPDLDSLGMHGTEYSIPQKPAGPASGNYAISVTDNIVVETNAVLQRTDGVEFLVTAGGSLSTSGTLTVPIIAATDGAIGNCDPNTPLDMVSGFSTTSSTPPTGQVDSNGLTLGTDVEDIESWRARILFRKRNPPHGGSAADYVMWAGQVAGVSFFLDRPTVYVERLWLGPGTVRVFPLMYDLYANGIPQASDVQRVQEYIETLRPAGAKVTVAAPQPVVVNVTIAGLQPNTADVQEAVLAELKDCFFRLSRPAGGDDAFGSMPYLASPFSFSLSWIWQSVANATGEQRHRIVSPSADIALQAGQMAVLGSVTFTT